MDRYETSGLSGEAFPEIREIRYFSTQPVDHAPLKNEKRFEVST